MTQHSGSARHGASRAGQAAQTGGFPTAGMSLCTPLVNSLIPSVAADSPTPTFSRASTAYVQDHEAMMRNCIANEARFWGARRVQSLSGAQSGVLGAGGYSLTSCTRNGTITGPDGRSYGRFDASGAADFVVNQTTPSSTPGGGALANRTFLTTVYAYTDAAQLSNDLNDDCGVWVLDASAGNFLQTYTRLTTTPQRMQCLHTFNGVEADTTLYCRFDAFDRITPVAGRYVYLSQMMLEEVTGQSVQTPSGWIGSGDISLGSNVAGVQYLDTVRLHTQNLWPNSSMAGAVGVTPVGPSNFGSAGSCLIGATETVNGVATKIINFRRVAASGAQGLLAQINVNGSNYRFGFTYNVGVWVRRVGGVTVPASGFTCNDNTFIDANTTIASKAAIDALPAGVWTFFSVATPMPCRSSTTGIALFNDPGGVNAGEGFDYAMPQVTMVVPSVLQATSAANYNATGVSAVNNGTDTGTTAPIPATTLLGRVAETNGTQLVTPTASIRNMTDASWVASGGDATWLAKGAGVCAFTSVGNDGVPNAATRLTASGANCVLMQAAPATAAGFYCTSFRIRRITGTGNIDVTVDGGVTWATVAGLTAGVYVRGSSTLNLALNTARVGIRLVTATDAIDVDFCQMEPCGGLLLRGSTPITVSGVDTRGGDSLNYPNAGNISASLGSFYWEWAFDTVVPAIANNTALSFAGTGSYVGLSAGNPNAGQFDGTNFFVTGGTIPAINFSSSPACGTWGSGQRLAGRNQTPATAPFSGSMGAITSLSMSPCFIRGMTMFQRNARVYAQQLSAAQQDAMVV